MTTTSKLTTFRRTLALVGACAAMAAAPMSFAAPQGAAAVPSVAVNYTDLNLASSAGVDALYHRISVAARAVCPNPDIRELAALSAAESCRVEAVARAVREVNNPKLAVVAANRISHG